MKNGVFINCTALSEYAFMDLPTGKNSFQTVLDYAKSLPEMQKIIILCKAGREDFYSKAASEASYCGKCDIVTEPGEEWDTSALFSMFSRYSGEFDNFFYIFGDTPFLDMEAAERMYKNHVLYSAQYSFSDGGPFGITPEIIASEIAEALKVLSDKNRLKLERDAVFAVIQRDINTFDIETDITVKDLRMLRISLTADSKRNFMMLTSFCRAGLVTEKRILDLGSDERKMLRTLPAYYSIQITDRCCQSCSYCPYPVINPLLLEGGKTMSLDDYCKILEKISMFSGDAVISVSHWGEPSTHPQIEDLIFRTLEHENLSLLIETSGLGWKPGIAGSVAERLSGNSGGTDSGRLMWIVSLDTDDRETYKKIRGEGFSEALSFAGEISALFPETAYIQAVRMKENDPVLEKFYKSWKKDGKKMIVQKYDNFCGMLPDRKVTDISPLRRDECWHLKRDMTILMDGTVPLCREDVSCSARLGNVFEDSLESIWEQGGKYYIEQVEGKYNGICRQCDEYYTYNF